MTAFHAVTRQGLGAVVIEGTGDEDVSEDEGAIVARVIDNGHGFARAELAKAGVPFRRFDRPGAVTGAGMGLAIAMSLARRMGGAVRLDGTPGGGSVAELRLAKA